MIETLYISSNKMHELFYDILIKYNVQSDEAELCAQIFTANSLDGVYTHGVNRFSRFIKNIKDGFVIPGVSPTIENSFGGIESWNGNLGAGPVLATKATERSMQLARDHGIGCLTLSNTNHWMRGGTYGWQAAKAGLVFIGWTNTIANMPAWKAVDNKLGNNPIVISVPFNNEAIVLDMALSQFSFGGMELSAMKGEQLPVPGGFDADGNMTSDPQAILRSKRPLPVGYWKGAGLSLLLDILATILSGGSSTAQITKKGVEHGVSQVFICIDLQKLKHSAGINSVINSVIEDYKNSIPADGFDSITFPGERVLKTREKNKANGIPVLKDIWNEIEAL